MFKTVISARGDSLCIKSCSGKAEKVVFTQILDERGEHVLVERPSEKYSLYYEIQKYADECDINCIIARYMNGDLNALNKKQGMYGDFVAVPSSYREYLDVALKAQMIFNQLPADERAKFGSVEQFIMSFDKTDDIKKPVEDPVEQKEVTDNDTEE